MIGVGICSVPSRYCCWNWYSPDMASLTLSTLCSKLSIVFWRERRCSRSINYSNCSPGSIRTCQSSALTRSTTGWLSKSTSPLKLNTSTLNWCNSTMWNWQRTWTNSGIATFPSRTWSIMSLIQIAKCCRKCSNSLKSTWSRISCFLSCTGSLHSSWKCASCWPKSTGHKWTTCLCSSCFPNGTATRARSKQKRKSWQLRFTSRWTSRPACATNTRCSRVYSRWPSCCCRWTNTIRWEA